MIKCGICNVEFKNNLGGDLTRHLKEIHNMSFEDYFILTKLNNIEPKCICGYCDERPKFLRNKFLLYAVGHKKHNWIEKKYIELNGVPKCGNQNCNNHVKFNRGIPNKYCSFKCHPSQWNQETINKTVNERYKIKNVFQLETVKEKSKATSIIKYGFENPSQSNIIKERTIQNNVLKYGVEHPQQLDFVIKKRKETMFKNHGVDSYSKTMKFRKNASINMCKYNENIITNHTIKSYKETNLYYQSQYEFRFLMLCENLNALKLIENSPRFNYLDNINKWHVPDFIFNEKYVIEIKSSYWLKRQGGDDVIKRKKESVISKGLEYILILDENYNEFFKIVSNSNIK